MGKPICVSEMISVVTSTVMMYLFVGWKTIRDVAKGGGQEGVVPQPGGGGDEARYVLAWNYYIICMCIIDQSDI